MKNKIFNFLIVIIIAVFVLAYINVREKQRSMAQLPGLTVGEKITYFDLVSEEGNEISLFNLKKDKISAIFIFQEPCMPCNNNIPMWKRIANIIGNKMDTYGIIFAGLKDIREVSSLLKFKCGIYFPKNSERFKKIMRIKYKLAQTLLSKNGKIIYSKTGDIEVEDYFKIVNLINGG